jgi:hypothetical protein
MNEEVTVKPVCTTCYQNGNQWLILDGKPSERVKSEVALVRLAAKLGIEFNKLHPETGGGTQNCFYTNWYETAPVNGARA